MSDEMTDEMATLRDRLRRAEAEVEELHRDHADLAALDATGQIARILELENTLEQRRLREEDLSDELREERSLRHAAETRVRVLERDGDAVRVAAEQAEWARLLDEATTERDAFRAQAERRDGEAVTDLLTGYRETIRSLTAELLDAQARADR